MYNAVGDTNEQETMLACEQAIDYIMSENYELASCIATGGHVFDDRLRIAVKMYNEPDGWFDEPTPNGYYIKPVYERVIIPCATEAEYKACRKWARELREAELYT